MSIENYGYIINPPDWQEGDEHRSHNQEAFEKVSWEEYQYCLTPPLCQRRRRIQAGEGYRILGLDEKLPKLFEYSFDGINWKAVATVSWVGSTIESFAGDRHIIAVRVRIPLEQEVKKDLK